MALKYNLSKVYALSDDNFEYVQQMVHTFAIEVTEDLKKIKEGIDNKNHQQTYTYAHKIKPSLDLMGLHLAFEEMLQVEAWTKVHGRKKDIIETFKSVKKRIKEAVKEIKKDFDL